MKTNPNTIRPRGVTRESDKRTNKSHEILARKQMTDARTKTDQQKTPSDFDYNSESTALLRVCVCVPLRRSRAKRCTLACAGLAQTVTENNTLILACASTRRDHTADHTIAPGQPLCLCTGARAHFVVCAPLSPRRRHRRRRADRALVR